MKKLFMFAAIFLMSSHTFSKEKIISYNGVRSLLIGDSISKVKKIYKKNYIKKVDLLLEGDPSPALEIYLKKNSKKPFLTVEEGSKNKIYRMTVHSDIYKTKNGYSVGSRLKEVNTKYKGYVAYAEGSVFFITGKGLFLLLDYTTEQYSKNQNVPESTLVKSILIVGKNN